MSIKNKHIFSTIIAFCFLFFSFVKTANSQQSNAESGLPHFINYPAKQYKIHDQNWCIVQDSLGLIYIGNTFGLVVFDGSDFDLIPNDSRIFALGKDKDGNIFYGAVNDFGIIQQNEFGKLKLNSFKKMIPMEYKSFGEIWTIQCVNNQVLFSSQEHVYAFENNKISILKPAKGNGIHKCFKLKNNYLVREHGGGFSYLSNNKLNFIKGSEIFNETMVDFIQEIDNKILVGTRKNGFYEMEWNPKVNADECKLIPITFPVSNYFKEGELYHGILLSNKNLCFATKKAGVFISDQQGNLIEHYTEENGFLYNMVWYLFEDKDMNLWAASNRGISMIDYLTPIRQYTSIQGISGSVDNVNVIDDELFVSSDLGLFKGIETAGGLIFKPYLDFKSPSFHITKFRLKDIDDMIVCSRGLTAIRNNLTIPIEEGIEYKSSIQCEKNPQLLIAAGKNLISIYKFENNQYNLISEYEHYSNFRCIVEDENGEIWVSGDNKSLIKIDITNEKSIAYKSVSLEMPTNIQSDNFMFKYRNKVLICSLDGIFEVNSFKNKISFKKSTLFPPQIQNNDVSIFRAYIDKKENFWFAMDNSALKGVIAKFTLNGDTKNSFNNLLFNKYQEIQKNGFCLDSKGNLWIASSDGLLKFNTNEQIHYKNNFPVFIKQVTLKNDSSFSLIRGFIPDVLKKQLPFELNDISFRFSAANYSGVNDLYFSSRLLPLEDNFGEWTLLRNKNYSYLPEGKYTLEVKAKDIFNNYSNIKRFTFEIAPPWYRTKLAYFLYFVLAIALIYGLIKFNTIRLRAVNDLLEKTVKERTHELWEERDKLSEANLEITDSINYAKIIQQSILPDVKTFKKTFTDSFILFKPRNIVSGDFYWFSLAGVNNKTKYNLSQHIIVAADCTGHGVPGAFMSMIGSEKLNQSIAEIDDLTPSNMLSFMNRKIKDSLKQEEGNSQSKDGMEISLCFLDTDTNILTFAGANRPLWIYRKGCTLDSVEIIKPTKAGIAGHTSADQVFEETEIQLYKGDTVYLFTDGAPDQFGGAKNKKLTTKGLRQLLFDIQSQNMEQQGKSINGFYRSWMGNTNEQVDDILIMGIRI